MVTASLVGVDVEELLFIFDILETMGRVFFFSVRSSRQFFGQRLAVLWKQKVGTKGRRGGARKDKNI